MTEIKQCSCGAVPQICITHERVNGFNEWESFVWCDTCKTLGISAHHSYKKKACDEAVELWNNGLFEKYKAK